MSFFGKIGNWAKHQYGGGLSMNGLKSSVKGTARTAAEVGHYAAPIIALGNPLLGAGIAALSDAGRGKSFGDMLKDAALTGGAGFALGHAGDIAGKVGGFFGHAGAADGAVAGAAGAASNVGEVAAAGVPRFDLARAGVNAVTDGGGRSLASAAGNFLKSNAKDLAIGAGHVASAGMQMSAQNAQTNLQRRELADREAQVARENQIADQNAAAMNPIRQQLLEQLRKRMGLPPVSAAPNPYYSGTGSAPSPYSSYAGYGG